MVSFVKAGQTTHRRIGKETKAEITICYRRYKLCQEEIELDRQGVVEQAVGEASVEEAGAVAGWEAIGLEPDQVGSVFVPIVGHGYPIRWELPATT